MTDETVTPTSPEEQQAEENKLIAQRREKLNEIRSQGQAYPNHFRRANYAADLQAEHGEKTKPELEELGIQVSVAGRVVLNRGAFIVLQDMTGRIQLYVNRKTLSKEKLALQEMPLGDGGEVSTARCYGCRCYVVIPQSMAADRHRTMRTASGRL